MDATPRHGRAALAAFAGLALVVVLVWGSAHGGDRRDSIRAPFALDP